MRKLFIKIFTIIATILETTFGGLISPVTPTPTPVPIVTSTPTPIITSTPTPTVTNTPTPTENPELPADGTVITFDVANIDGEGIADKEEIPEGTIFDGFVTSTGNNIYRTKKDSINSIEVGKAVSGKLSFILENTATVVITVSSSGSSNTSAFALADIDGNVCANSDGSSEISGITMTDFIYYNLPSGEYEFYSPENDEYHRGVRISRIVVTYGVVEVPAPTATPTPTATNTPKPTSTPKPTVEPVDGAVATFDVANIDGEGIADKEEIPEGTIFDGFATSVGSNIYRVRNDEVYAIETGRDAKGKLEFEIGNVATIVITVSSTGSTNTSVFALTDKGGNTYSNTAESTMISGLAMTDFTYTNVPAGMYEFFSPENDEYNRGVRVSKIVVTYGAVEN